LIDDFFIRRRAYINSCKKITIFEENFLDMNRLVMWKQFDLAHGLPTSDKDFIDDYWKNIKDSNHDELVA
jgi:uncharacterized protein Usg